ncbi:MAG: class I SAM-dependent methyltransferase [Terriglobales bacterium]
MSAQVIFSGDPALHTSIHILNELTAGYRGDDFAVRLWDGTLWGNTKQPRFTLIINSPGALRRMFLSPSELAFGEAFADGDFDIDGDLQAACKLADFFLYSPRSMASKIRLASLLIKLPAQLQHATGVRVGDRRLRADGHGDKHSKLRDREAISYHYDLSNDFYALWLDPRMVYSCAYFRSPQDSLEQAQEQKLDYICKKLRLRRGERILDLGCGWGALVMHAASNYGVCALGITLSAAQAELACARIGSDGLTDRCKVELCDYRDMPASPMFDKLVSVGMFEHVGEPLLPEYFRRAWELLRPGGLFLNHGIAVSSTFKRRGPSFINQHVFPDGELVPLNTTLRAAEASGFEVRDVESLREHYALTLQHWLRRLEANGDRARQLVGEVRYRVWRIYLAASAHAFTTGRLNVYQVLLSKPENGVSHLPLTREDYQR